MSAVPEGRGNTCGHIRCQSGACQWARPPALEALCPGEDRDRVRADYARLMLATMDADTDWCLHVAKVAELDGTRN